MAMNIKRDRKCIVLMAVLGWTGSAHTQSLDHAALQQLFGEPVTTSVTGAPQRASQVPATMVIVSADEIRRSGARDIPGVLRHVAGVDVIRWTSDHADVGLRGYNQAFSPRLLVLIDGRQVYADHYGYTPWTTLPVELSMIHQIEIIKGPASALFGFNAVSGAVNIVTRNPRTEEQLTFSTSVGTQEIRQASAVGAWRLGDDIGLRVMAGSRRSEDYTTPQRSEDLGTRLGNRRDVVAADGRFSPGEKLSFGVEVTYSEVGQAEFPPGYTMSYTDYRVRSLRTHWSADTRVGLIEANIYRNYVDAGHRLGGSAAVLFDFSNDLTVTQLQNIFKIGTDHVVRMSAEYRESSLDTTPIAGGRVHYEVVTVGAMWHWAISPTLSFTNAFRSDEWSLGRRGPLPDQYEELYGWTNETWNRTLRSESFNTGVVWRATDSGTLRFSSGRGVQLPSLISLGGMFFEFADVSYAGTPTLEPSVVTSYELDWSQDLPSVAATLRIGAFHGYTRNVLSDFFNIGSSRTTGAELSLAGNLGTHWRWRAGYKHQQIADRFLDTIPFELSLRDFESTTPRHVVKAGFGWTSGAWEIDTHMYVQSAVSAIQGVSFQSAVSAIQGVGSGDAEPGASLMPIPAYATFDGRVAYALSERSSLAIAGRDLTNSAQRQTSAPRVQRQLYLTYSIDF